MLRNIIVTVLLSLCSTTVISQICYGDEASKLPPQVPLHASTDSLYSVLGIPDLVDSNRQYIIRTLERHDTSMLNTISHVNYLYYFKKGVCFIEKNDSVKLYEINFKFQRTTDIVISGYSFHYGINMEDICQILSIDESSRSSSKSYIIGEPTPLKCYCLSSFSQGKYPNDNIILFFNNKKKLIAMTIPYTEISLSSDTSSYFIH